MRTLEEYFIGLMEEKDERIEELERACAELERAQKEREEKESEMPLKLVDAPVDAVKMTVASPEDLARLLDRELTDKEAREKAETREGLLEVAGWEYPSYEGARKFIEMERRSFPCSINTYKTTHGIEFYDEMSRILIYPVYGNGEPAAAGSYFFAYREPDLFEQGLRLLKANLLKYADMLAVGEI